MQTATSNLLANVLELPANQRAELVEQILKSLDTTDPAIDRLWAEEAERRLDAVASGDMQTIAAEEVFAKYND